tara:strand:+ start:395 stop:511 length:117 start_codon:yes stop_codon:yes gene_type:complete
MRDASDVAGYDRRRRALALFPMHHSTLTAIKRYRDIER